MSGPYTVTWTTQDEISWLSAMARQSPQAFRAIAAIILRDGRRWDKHMDVGANKDACRTAAGRRAVTKEQTERAERWARRYTDDVMSILDAADSEVVPSWRVRLWLKIAYQLGFRAGLKDAKKEAGSK